jgi:hypothetical protein
MKYRLLALACSALGANLAMAAELKPTDASAPAPAPRYDSAFENYKPFREEVIADWRGLNEEVGRVGGHRGVMGGAKPAAAPTATTEGGQAPVRGAPTAPGRTEHSH